MLGRCLLFGHLDSHMEFMTRACVPGLYGNVVLAAGGSLASD